jgi:hypothetical protein
MTENILEAIATAEYAELCAMVADMSYEEAFKKLDGYNLTADPIMADGKWLSNNEFFDVEYKHIKTSIFRVDKNKCEVWEECDLSVHYTL